MLPPGGGTNNVDPRFLSLFSCFVLINPEDELLLKIYNSILKGHLATFDKPEFIELVPKIGQATLKIYNQIIQ